MKRSLFAKLLLSYLALAAGILVTVGFVTSVMVERNFYATKEREVREQANHLAQEMGRMWQSGAVDVGLLRRIMHFQEFTGSTVWIVDLSGKAYAVSATEVSLGLISVDSGPFGVLAQGEPWSERGWSDLFHQHMLSLGIPLATNPELSGIVVHTPLIGVRTTLARIQNILLQIALVTFITAILVCLPLSRHITMPLKRMTEIVGKMAKGEFGETVEAKGVDEIGLLARAFNDLGQRLGHTMNKLTKVERLRRDLVTNVSHELRTPLTSLRGFLEFASDPTTSPIEREEYLGIAMEESLRLNRLTEDLLDAARLENGMTPLRIQRTDVELLLTRIYEKTEPKFRRAGIFGRLDVSGIESPVMVDSDRIEQVMTNLLDNALRHTSEEGHVILRSRTDAHHLYVSVEDDGEGISDDDRPYIWERFFKGDKSRHKYEGSGLGLVIAKEIIKSHDGIIDVTSEVNVGTTVSFRLPLKQC